MRDRPKHWIFYTANSVNHEYPGTGTTRTVGASERSATVSNGTDSRYYLDTTLLDTDTGDGTQLVCQEDFAIGTYYDNNTFRRFNGRVGGARIRKSALSADWIATEDDNQNSTAAWTIASAWADSGGSAPIMASALRGA